MHALTVPCPPPHTHGAVGSLFHTLNLDNYRGHPKNEIKRTIPPSRCIGCLPTFQHESSSHAMSSGLASISWALSTVTATLCNDTVKPKGHFLGFCFINSFTSSHEHCRFEATSQSDRGSSPGPKVIFGMSQGLFIISLHGLWWHCFSY